MRFASWINKARLHNSPPALTLHYTNAANSSVFYFFLMVRSTTILHLQLDLERGLFLQVFLPNFLVYVF